MCDWYVQQCDEDQCLEELGGYFELFVCQVGEYFDVDGEDEDYFQQFGEVCICYYCGDCVEDVVQGIDVLVG